MVCVEWERGFICLFFSAFPGISVGCFSRWTCSADLGYVPFGLQGYVLTYVKVKHAESIDLSGVFFLGCLKAQGETVNYLYEPGTS